MIIDSHMHIFPFLGLPAGFPSTRAHTAYLQYSMVGHDQPVRRLKDHSSVPGETRAELPLDGPHRLKVVNFRVEENGRFLWSYNGEDVYMHFMPPSLQSNASSAEFILAQMAYIGVDVAVLQNAHPYGRLNEYFAATVAKYPGKFVGLAEVDEAEANTTAQLHHLRVAVQELGLKGLYYANRGFFFVNYKYNFHHPRYDEFWQTVRELKIPVFWELAGIPVRNAENYLKEVARLNEWASRYPEIPCVLTHGIAPSFLENNVPAPLDVLMKNDQFSVEVLYPISVGRTEEYPFAEVRPAIRELYRRVGTQRLIWGSDMPNVERNCTYRQALDYLRRHCEFIASSDMERMLGLNLADLFRLQ